MQRGLAFRRDWSGTAVNPGRRERPEILPRRLHRCGGASVVRREPQNRMEDLNVKVCEEAPRCPLARACFCCKARSDGGRLQDEEANGCSIGIASPDPKGGANGRPRFQDQECRSWLEAIARAGDVAIARGSDDCSDDTPHRVAATLGAWVSCGRGAQAPEAQPRLEEGGRQPGLPDRQPRKRQERRPATQA
jgi:hypothetical protein